MIELGREGEVFVLRMRSGENRFNAGFLADLGAALDEVEASSGPAALVTTGDGKFYSNGLDLEWMSGEGKEEAQSMLHDLYALFARLLTFPMATVAAINGHAFAGGAMLSLAHDDRVMRSDRGYFCLPEIDLGLALAPEMTAIITARMSTSAAHEAIVTGRRYAASDALERGIVDAIASEEDVLGAAIERVKGLTGKDRATMAALKRGLYPKTLAILGGTGGA